MSFDDHPKNAQLLIAGGAQLDAKDEFGRTALHWATIKGHTEVVRVLLQAGAQPNAKDKVAPWSSPESPLRAGER